MAGLLKSCMGLALLLFPALLPLTAKGAEVLGTKPRHVWGGPSAVINEPAMTKKVWAPGIDDGYIPQGVAWADGAVYLSSYRSTDPKVDKGPCRVYKIDAESGRTLAQFDLPQNCGHAGGLAFIGKGILVVSDTRRLYKIDATAAFPRDWVTFKNMEKARPFYEWTRNRR